MGPFFTELFKIIALILNILTFNDTFSLLKLCYGIELSFHSLWSSFCGVDESGEEIREWFSGYVSGLVDRNIGDEAGDVIED